MSTTPNPSVAQEYAIGRKSNTGIVFEMQQGMVDRGADISFLSQYPHEKEILFGPLTGVELLDETDPKALQPSKGGGASKPVRLVPKRWPRARHHAWCHWDQGGNDQPTMDHR